MKLKPTSRVAELGNTIGDELLKVQVSYGRLIQALLKNSTVTCFRRLAGRSIGKMPAAH
jgi:hypothetical protein